MLCISNQNMMHYANRTRALLKGARMILACIRESGLFKNILACFLLCFTKETIVPRIDVAN